jgi:hypothetical protein
MGVGGAVWRGEKFHLAFCPEIVYGIDPGTANYTNVFGVVETATLPDPLIDFMPIYALGTASNRNWYITYKGRIGIVGSIPEIWLLNGYPLYLPIGTVTTTGTGPYTHTINESTTLKSISIHVTNLDSNNNVALMRRYFGGKVNRAGFEAREGDFLKMSLDEITFINLTHNQFGEPFYSSGVADISNYISYPTTQPYLFSYGSLSLAGTTFARVRAFRLDVDNGMEPKYYVTNGAAASQLPYEYREGRRTYRLSCTIDVEDSSFYKELVRQGTYTSVYKGFQTELVFTRGANDTITFTTPPSAPAAGGDQMGCLIRSSPHPITTDPVVSTTLDILCRSLKIVVVDSIATYPGQS